MPACCRRRARSGGVSHTSHGVCHPVCNAPQPFKNRPSRVFPLSHPSQALPYPIPRLLSRPRCAWRWGALAGLPQRAGHAGRAMDGVWPLAGGAGGRAAGVAAPKGRLNFPDSTGFCGWWNERLKTNGMVHLLPPYCVEHKPAQEEARRTIHGL